MGSASGSLGYHLRLLLLPLGLCWLLCWLLPGLYLGDPTALLQGRAPTFWCRIYVACLYLSIVCITLYAWRRADLKYPQLLAWNRAWEQAWPLVLGLFGGSGAYFLQRLVLNSSGVWTPPTYQGQELFLSFGVGLVLAVGEELLFRGYLLGVLCQVCSRDRASLIVSLVFAVLHVLRPGALGFKLAYGLGIFLLSFALCQLVFLTGNLAVGTGFHAGLIAFLAFDQPTSIKAGVLGELWAGLQGELPASLLSWLLLTLLIVGVRRKLGPSTS